MDVIGMPDIAGEGNLINVEEHYSDAGGREREMPDLDENGKGEEL